MAGFLKKLVKGVLIGGGTVLSLINPAIGAPLIVAGSAIKTTAENNTMDTLSLYAGNLQQGLSTAASMSTAGNISMNVQQWYKKYPLLVVAGVVGLLLVVVRLFKK